MAACSGNAPRRFPEGAIVGQSVELGHLLREARTFEVRDAARQDVKVAIVGSGVAGLTAAWKLSKEGFHDFVVLELEGDVGGTSRSAAGTPVGYPWGAHYLPVPFPENTELISLLDEMALLERGVTTDEWRVKEQFLCREPEERIFYKGRWYDGLYLHPGESDEDKRQFVEFQKRIDYWVKWRDAAGRRAFVVPVANCSDASEATSLDRISFAAWLGENGFTSERLIWYCDYACRDDYGLKLEQTSAWAGLFYFCSRVRQAGDESQQFITFPEGNGKFTNHLADQVTDKISRAQPVVSIVPRDRSVDVVSYADGELRGFRCEHVIFAAPIFTAPYIIRGFADNAPFSAAEFHHNAWFVANLFLKDRPTQRFARDFPLSWDSVFYDSPSLGYVNATHQKGIDHGPTIFTYYYPMCHEPEARTKLFNYTWQELADVCLTDIARAHPDIYDLTTRLDIMRWGHAMISPRPNFIWSGIRESAVKPWRNIHFAHTDLSGIALFEEAFYHGLRAATEILTARGRGG